MIKKLNFSNIFVKNYFLLSVSTLVSIYQKLLSKLINQTSKIYWLLFYLLYFDKEKLISKRLSWKKNFCWEIKNKFLSHIFSMIQYQWLVLGVRSSCQMTSQRKCACVKLGYKQIICKFGIITLLWPCHKPDFIQYFSSSSFLNS